jgi:hypothetical protein
MTFDLEAARAEIKAITGPVVSPLAGIAYDHARRAYELDAELAGALATLAILRGDIRPPSCNRDGIEAEFTLDGLHTEAAGLDPAEVNALNQLLADDLDHKDTEIRSLRDRLSQLQTAFVDLTREIDRRHISTDPHDVCVPDCGACDLLDLVPVIVLATAQVAVDAHHTAQGDEA